MKNIIIADLDNNCCDCVMNIDDTENSIELEFNHVSFSDPVIHIKLPTGTTYQITDGTVEGSLNRALKYTLPKFYWNVSGEVTIWVTDGLFTSNEIIIQCTTVESYQNVRVENVDGVYIVRTFGQAKTIQEQIDEISNLLGKKLFIYTKTNETINSTAYHGAATASAYQNDYPDLFDLNSGGAYLTYNGTRSCIISGIVNVKIVKDSSTYVHLRTGIYNSNFDTNTTAEITPSVIDTSGRWYAIPFMFTINPGDRFWFLYTYADSAYVKVEEMRFQMKVEGYIGV